MLASVVREATRLPGGPLNVLLFRSEDDVDLALCRSGHRFFAAGHPGERPWDLDRLVPPDNLVFLDGELGEHQIPADVDFDLVVCPLREPQVHNARKASAALHAPLVTLAVDPPPRGEPGRAARLLSLGGHARVYPTAEGAAAWGDDGEGVRVAWRWAAQPLAAVLEGALAPYRLLWEVRA